jgi:hypothetical protein
MIRTVGLVQAQWSWAREHRIHSQTVTGTFWSSNHPAVVAKPNSKSIADAAMLCIKARATKSKPPPDPPYKFNSTRLGLRHGLRSGFARGALSSRGVIGSGAQLWAHLNWQHP